VFITFVLGRSSNKVPVNSNIEELQQEIRRCQQQVQLTEERLRLFEPDAAALASATEIEACQKFLLDTLARVQDRKVLLILSPSLAVNVS
jgi:hypothetical protein